MIFLGLQTLGSEWHLQRSIYHICLRERCLDQSKTTEYVSHTFPPIFYLFQILAGKLKIIDFEIIFDRLEEMGVDWHVHCIIALVALLFASLTECSFGFAKELNYFKSTPLRGIGSLKV